MSKGGSSSSSGPPREFIQGWEQNLQDARNVASQLGPQPIAGAHHNHIQANRNIHMLDSGSGARNTAAAAQMAQNLGMSAAGGNYDPMMVGGASAGPAALFGGAQAGPANQFGGAQDGPANQFGGASADRGDIRNVMAGSMPGQGMASYMNPYTDQVIDRSMQDMARQRDLAMQGIGGAAAKAGAFGGARHGVVEGEAHRGFADAAARTSADLRHRGFDQASQLMQQDMNRGMQAGLANQGMDAQIAMLNPQLQQQTGLANMGAQNQMRQFDAGQTQQAGLANMNAANQMRQFDAGNLQQAGLANQMAQNQMGQFNAGQMQQANLANQAAHLSGMGLGLQGMNLGLQGAQLQGQLGDQQYSQQMNQAQGLASMGDFFRNDQQQRLDASWQLPMLQQQMRNEAIGLGGGMNTSSSRSREGLLGPLSNVAGAAIGSGLFSDRRLKENIVELGPEPVRGLPWYEFSYLGDARRFRGVMADDVERHFPGAVHLTDQGYKVVDYDALGIDMLEVPR